MSIDLSRFHQVFFDESAEHLAEMERLLLALDVGNPDLEELNAIFRAAHSIKGGSATVGFNDMTEVTHILENLLDKLRKNELVLRTDMVDAFLEATDVIKDQLSAHMNNEQPDPDDAIRIRDKLTLLAQEVETGLPVEAMPIPARYSIEFSLGMNAPKDGINNLISSLGSLGELEIIEPAKTIAAKKSKDKNRKKPAVIHWKLRLISHSSIEEIRGLFEFLLNPEDVLITTETESVSTNEAYGLFSGGDAEPYGLFEESAPATTSAETGYGLFEDIPVQKPNEVLQEESKEQREARTGTDRRTVERRGLQDRAPGAETSSIRVSVEKVDQLINLIGELVITQAMLKQSGTQFDPVLHERLHAGMGQLERNTRDLQESVMSIRMMPISFVFSRFPRVVRDLAGKLGKQVELILVGENTELDKSLIEKISDPLTHLVRNSLDHGIETPDKRLAAGKPEKGTITLTASHQGGSIIIEVADDGAGLNRDKILSKAREHGLDVSGIQSDHDVWQLIYAPGFSTADVVTDVSGRGVGMDVVMRNITELSGTVDIESIPSQGTRMTVRLPLTLAILDGMTVSLGGNIYVIPLNLIVETLQPSADDIKTVAGQGRMVRVRGEYLPIIALHQAFNLPSDITDPCEGILVLIEADGKKATLLVDALVGQQQVVIKSLETNFRKIAGVSGATIMGDGSVAMILDVPALIKIGQTNT